MNIALKFSHIQFYWTHIHIKLHRMQLVVQPNQITDTLLTSHSTRARINQWDCASAKIKDKIYTYLLDDVQLYWLTQGVMWRHHNISVMIGLHCGVQLQVWQCAFSPYKNRPGYRKLSILVAEKIFQCNLIPWWSPSYQLLFVQLTHIGLMITSAAQRAWWHCCTRWKAAGKCSDLVCK